MTVISFLTSLFQMFNLTAYIDNSGTIVVKTLDSYYASGSASPIVIDEYLDVTKSTSNVALPFKEIVYKYKGLGTFLAKQYNQLNNIEWGTLKYTLNNETFDAPNNTYKVEIPFEHVLYERLINLNTAVSAPANETTIQYGYFVDDNQESYYGLPLIFYAIEVSNGTDIALQTGTGTEEVDDYIIPSNSLEIGTTNETNINFSAEINEYDGSEYIKTLFNNNYSTYINNVFNISRRLLKVDAVLPQKIFHNLQLNDLIQIRQQNYQINSITTNLTNGKSQLELLNVGTPYYRVLPNVSYQGSVGTLYYNYSVGVAASLSIGDTMYNNATLTSTASSGTYFQTGSTGDDTVCQDSSYMMSMTLDSNGIITNIVCGQP